MDETSANRGGALASSRIFVVVKGQRTLQTALALLKLAWAEAKCPILSHSLTLAALVCIELRVRATKALKGLRIDLREPGKDRSRLPLVLSIPWPLP